ncbi:MAG: MarR family transcriptional regulator [Rhodospirillales bacterium]|nr:MarR family transcriptional regulator [Rhodospirillales bacterium]
MDRGQIDAIRRFNRLIAQRIGALEQSYLRRGRPLGEARVIFEIGPDGAELGALRDRLGLDSGYLSRLLRALEAQGLIEIAPDAEDRRRRRAHLTAQGTAERAAYDLLSDALATGMLAPLPAEGRARLIAAMAEIEKLLAPAPLGVGVALDLVSPASAPARRCLRAYFRELAARFEGGFDPTGALAEAAREMTPPSGWFLIARAGGQAVGCAGLRRIDASMGEVKRMWVAPEARGQGLARSLLRRLEALAGEQGMRVLRLDTNRALAEARALYEREGYRAIPRYNDNPYAHLWFEKTLAAPGERGS